MFSWLEAIYYTLIQLAKVSIFNTFLLMSFVLYLCYQGFKFFKQPLLTLFQKIKQLITNRDSVWENIKAKKDTFLYSWKHRKDIDWRSKSKAVGEKTWHFIKRLVVVIPSLLLLIFGNLLFRLIYQLPFVKQDRKRFDKEMKPLLLSLIHI